MGLTEQKVMWVASVRASRRAHLSGRVIEAISSIGGEVTRVDVSHPPEGVVHLMLQCRAGSDVTGEGIARALSAVDGCVVDEVEPGVFRTHLGGVIGMDLRSGITGRDDLVQVYSIALAPICAAITQETSRTRELTIKGNAVAVVTDGSAVLGLGSLGPEGALPATEGKAALLKWAAGIDAWPIPLATSDLDEIVRTIEAIMPAFGGILLEGFAASRSFEVERRLRRVLPIPVIHDAGHGMPVVALAALHNIAVLVGAALPALRVVIVGAGESAAAVAQLAHGAQVVDVVVLEPDAVARSAGRCLETADAVLVLSHPSTLTDDELREWAGPAVFVDLAEACTGICSTLACPGILRGLLDAGASSAVEEALLAAAVALAASVDPRDLSEQRLLPGILDISVTRTVAEATRSAAETVGA